MEQGESEEIVVKNPDFEVVSSQIGAYRIVRIRGAYNNELLDELRTKVFPENTSFAVDTSELKGITTPFARELLYTAKLLRETDHRLVLLKPNARLISLLSLLNPDEPLATFLNEGHLTDDPTASDNRTIHAAHALERIQTELQENKFWQVLDREGCWICPYCATLREDVVIISFNNVAPAVVETMYRHLWFKCSQFSPVKPAARTFKEMKEVQKRVNKDKIVVTRKQMKRMASKMTYLEDRAKKADALEHSVKIASERQRRILPARAPDVEGAEIGIVFRPAEQVSGDFYDFVPLSDGRMAFLIGDVSGHGIEAGIVMGMAKKVLALRLEELGDPVEAISRTNHDLFKDLDRVSFVTVFVGVYDPQARTLSAVRAGHNPPILFHPDRTPKVIELDGGGLGIGLTDGQMFDKALQCRTVGITPGEVLLLYTDGLIEARNPAGEEFGVDRVVKVLERTIGMATPFLVSDLACELDQFSQGLPQEDDVTAVCIRFF